MHASTDSVSTRPLPLRGTPGSPWLQVSLVFGALGEALGAAAAGLLTLMLSIDPTHERLQDVLGTVALWCGAAVVAGLFYHRHDARVQLAVHLGASLSLAAAAYAVLLERGDVDLAIGFFLYCTLAPLALCLIAALVAAAVVVRARARRGARYVLAPVAVAVAAAAIPALGALAGDPGDAAEAAIRHRLGSRTLVTCATWELEPGTVLCAIDAGAWTDDCVIRMGANGKIGRSRSLWGSDGGRCRRLER